MEINIKLDAFEGPLDLLLHLIEKNQVNIYDIPIVEITDQYLEIVQTSQNENLDMISDFLVMAAELTDIKCRMLLPRQVSDEEGEDPRSELVERLLEYKIYRQASIKLKSCQTSADRAIVKPPTIPDEVSSYQEPVDTDQLLEEVTLSKLRSVFDFVMKRREDKVDEVHGGFRHIRKETVKVEDKIFLVMSYGAQHSCFNFDDLFENQISRTEVVVTFQAVLELLRMGRLRARQEKAFDTIHLELIDDTPVVFDENGNAVEL